MDHLDRKIIQELQKDAAIGNAELARRVGSTTPSCWRRIRQLEEDGVLKGAVQLADRKALGLAVTVICQVRLNSHTQDCVSTFEQFVASEPMVMECYSMSGEWDYQLQIVADDVEAFETFLMRRLLKQGVVATASSHFSLRIIKYTTALPVRG